jgi:hypothetical protein
VSGVNSSKISLSWVGVSEASVVRAQFCPDGLAPLWVCLSTYKLQSCCVAASESIGGVRGVIFSKKGPTLQWEFSGVSVDYQKFCSDRLDTLWLFLSRCELCACGVAPSESVRGVGSVNSSKISLRTSEFERRLSFVLSCAPMVLPLGGYVYRPTWRLPAAWHLVNRFRA